MAASHQGQTVFICHAGESKPFVRQLVDRLKTDGLKEDQIFFDERSLETGDELDSIVKVIESPSLKLFVFVVSKYCFDVDRTWIRTEWEAALENNKQIFPIWLDDNNDDFKAFGNLVRKFSYKLRKVIAQRVNPQEISTSLPGISEKICSLVYGDQPTQQRPPRSTDVRPSSVRPNFMPDVLPAKLKLEFVQKVYNQILEKSEKLFDDDTLKDEERLKEADKIFNRYKARKVSIIPGDCFIFNLRFLQPCDVDDFYHDHFRLGPESLSAALTNLLITDQMRAAAGGEELMVRVEVRYDDYIRVRRQLCLTRILKSTSVDNLSALVRPRTDRSVRGPSLESLDLAITRAQDSSVTEWAAYPYTRLQARCVKWKSQRVTALEGMLEVAKHQAEILEGAFKVLYRECTLFDKKDEDTKKEIKQLQQSNENLEARVEVLMAAKAKVPSSEEDIAPKSTEGRAPEELETQVAALTRKLEIQGNIVWTLYGKMTYLNKRDEDAQKVLMSKTEEINQFQEENENLKAIIEALMAAKTKAAVHSSEEDKEVRAPGILKTPLSEVEGGAPEEPETPLSGVDGGAPEEPETPLSGGEGGAPEEPETPLSGVEGRAAEEPETPLSEVEGGAPVEPETPLSGMEVGAPDEPEYHIGTVQLGDGADVTRDEDIQTQPVANAAPELKIFHAHELDIDVVYYRVGIVLRQHVTNKTGCRLWFGDQHQLNLRRIVDPKLVPYLYGPADAEQILLPHGRQKDYDVVQGLLNQKDDEVVQGMLNNMARGLVLTTDNGNISATRLCKTKVFWKSNDNRNRQPELLEREQVVPVFNYQTYLRELSTYANSGGPKPKCEVIFSFGKSWSDESPLENTPIYVIVRSRTAHKLMMAFDMEEELGSRRQGQVSSIDDMISDEDGMDKLAVQVKEVVKAADL